MRFFLMIFLLMAQCAAAQSLTVNGEPVSDAKVKATIDLLKERGSTEDEKELLSLARGIVIQNMILFQEAKKQRLDKDRKLQALIDEQRAKMIGEALLEKNVYSAEPKEEDLKKKYEGMRKNYNPNEIKVRQILVPTSEEAEQLIGKIKSGQDMAQLAKQYSIDAGSAEKGGEFPYVNVRAISIPGFAQAAMMMKPGELMPVPFETSQGFLVVRLEGKRKIPMPEYEAVKARLQREWRKTEGEKYMTQLLQKAKIVRTGTIKKTTKK